MRLKRKAEYEVWGDQPPVSPYGKASAARPAKILKRAPALPPPAPSSGEASPYFSARHTKAKDVNQPTLRERTREWLYQEITFTMNKVSLAGLVFGLMVLGVLFFIIGFLVAATTLGTQKSAAPQQQRVDWSQAAHVRQADPSQPGATGQGRSSLRDQAAGYTAQAIGRLTREKSQALESRFLGSAAVNTLDKVPEPLQPFAMHAAGTFEGDRYRAEAGLQRGVARAVVAGVTDDPFVQSRPQEDDLPGPQARYEQANAFDQDQPEAPSAPNAYTPRAATPQPGSYTGQQAASPRRHMAQPKLAGYHPHEYQRGQRANEASFSQQEGGRSSYGKRTRPSAAHADQIAGKYSLQIAAYPEPGKAKALSKQLSKLGLSSYIMRGRDSAGNQAHVVRIGDFKSFSDAQAASLSFKNHFQYAPMIVTARR